MSEKDGSDRERHRNWISRSNHNLLNFRHWFQKSNGLGLNPIFWTLNIQFKSAVKVLAFHAFIKNIIFHDSKCMLIYYQKQIRNYRGVIKSAYFEWLFSKEVASASLILLFESQTWLRIWFFSLFNEFEDMIRKHQIQQIHLNHNYES